MKLNSKICIILIMAITIMSLLSCVLHPEDENHHQSIRIRNNSSKTIYVAEGVWYPDTMSIFGIAHGIPESHEISSGGVNEDVFWMFDFWEDAFGDVNAIKSDTIIVFILDGKARTLPAKEIPQTIIQRYDIGLKDLQRTNWLLTYPPSESMKDIKMWPPYGSSIKY